MVLLIMLKNINYTALLKMRELPFMYTICQLIVSEKRCFNTEERIEQMQKDLTNKNLKSPYNYKYVIRSFSKTVYFNSVFTSPMRREISPGNGL